MAVSEAPSSPAPSSRPVEAGAVVGAVRYPQGGLDLDVAQRKRLDDQAAGQLHVIQGVGAVAQPEPEHLRELPEDGDQ